MKSRIGILFVLLTLAISGCALFELPTKSPTPESPSVPPPNTPSKTTPTPTPTLPPARALGAISWEAGHPERKAWSDLVASVVREEAVRFSKVTDMHRFCPKFSALDYDRKVQAWVELFSAISKFESDWSPVSRMKETTMGNDPITGLSVYSEGLLQLSYQDKVWAPYCAFDWAADSKLAATDPKKTILDPLKNLDCGVRIMARQIERRGKIALESGVYWAVIKDGGKYQKIQSIANMVAKVPGCI